MVILVFKEAGIEIDLNKNNVKDVIHAIEKKFVSKIYSKIKFLFFSFWMLIFSTL